MKRSGNNPAHAVLIAALLLHPAMVCAQGSPRPDNLPQSFEKQGMFAPAGQGQVLPLRIQSLADPPPGSMFDVISYQLDLKAAMANEDFGGRTLITLRLLIPRDSIELYQLKLQIDSALVDGAPATFTVNDAAERFVVRLGGTRQPGDTLHIAVWYRRIPGIPRETLRLGYNYFSDTTTGIPAALGYTMSEPREARCWMPCYDEPWDKATAVMNITVPTGYVAASNGILDGVTTNGDSTVTWHWHEGHQIATYLMCVTISRFTIPEMKFARAPGDTIPLQYYVWAQDSLQTATYLPIVKLMVVNLSNVFGPYPWDKYGMSCVSPFDYGGMEHQSITTLHEAYRTNELVVVHELAHQWWGDLVTCGSWSDIWLNESFATYGEALWRESLGGSDALKAYMADIQQFSLVSWSGRTYNTEAQGFGVFPSSVYTKGAWILHTLRGVIGDSSFFRCLRQWRATYAERSAVTADFQSVVESVTGTDLAWFFDEWIYGNGWPVYSTSFRWAGDTLFFRIDQQQSSTWPTYKMPLTMGVYSAGILSKFTVVDSLRSQSFVVPWRSVPDSLAVDPDGWVLKQREGPPFERPPGSGPGQFVLLQNYPNPFNPGTDIPFVLPRRSVITLEIYDMLGQKIKNLFLAKLEPGGHSVHFDGTGLATGVYLYRLQARPIDGTPPMTAAGKMMLVK